MRLSLHINVEPNRNIQAGCEWVSSWGRLGPNVREILHSLPPLLFYPIPTANSSSLVAHSPRGNSEREHQPHMMKYMSPLSRGPFGRLINAEPIALQPSRSPTPAPLDVCWMDRRTTVLCAFCVCRLSLSQYIYIYIYLHLPESLSISQRRQKDQQFTVYGCGAGWGQGVTVSMWNVWMTKHDRQAQ